MAKPKSSSTSKSTRTSAAKAPQAVGTGGAVASKRTTKPAAASKPESPVVVTAAATPKRRASKAKAVLAHDQVARRAYEIWVRKGRPNGLDEQNWREAEQELLAGV